jgi:GNAT superfamily N-acetyltransferase
MAAGTVLSAPPPWSSQITGWRIRGMATVESARGQGLGRLVLDALLEHVARHGGGVVWCHARVRAADFYHRAGFEARGVPFDLPGIGPHLCMWRTVEHARPHPDVTVPT